jgi:hypothetical protein
MHPAVERLREDRCESDHGYVSIPVGGPSREAWDI